MLDTTEPETRELTREEYAALVAVRVEKPIVVEPLPVEDVEVTFIGAYYGSPRFLTKWGVVYTDGSRCQDDTLRYINETHQMVVGGRTIHNTGHLADTAQLRTNFESVFAEVERKGGKYTAICIVNNTREADVDGVLFMSVSRTVINWIVGTLVGSMPFFGAEITYKDIRKAANTASFGYKKRVAELTRSIGSYEQSLKYYRDTVIREKEKLAAEESTRKLIESLSPEILEAINKAYRKIEVNPRNLTEAIRSETSYSKYIDEMKAEIAAIPIPAKRKKSELQTMVNLTNQLGKVYMGPNPHSFYILFNNELTLKDGKASIHYGKVAVYLEFSKNRQRLTLRYMKGYSLTYGRFQHPHLIGENNFCPGEAETLLINAYQSGSFPTIVNVMWKYLNTYNSGSPLSTWATCAEVMKNVR